MTVPVKWPSVLKVGAVATPELRGRALAGPRTLTGRSLQVAIDAGYWEVGLSRVAVTTPAAVAAYRALRSGMVGGAVPVRLPIFDIENAPWVASGGLLGNQNPGQTFAGGHTFSGGYKFYDPSIRVYLNQAAALRDTSVEVEVEASGTILAGMLFSLPGDRLHIIDEVGADTVSPAIQVWQISPPLRRAYSVGARCEFEAPKLRAKLVLESAEPLSLAVGRYGFTDMTFREAEL